MSRYSSEGPLTLPEPSPGPPPVRAFELVAEMDLPGAARDVLRLFIQLGHGATLSIRRLGLMLKINPVSGRNYSRPLLLGLVACTQALATRSCVASGLCRLSTTNSVAPFAQ